MLSVALIVLWLPANHCPLCWHAGKPLIMVIDQSVPFCFNSLSVRVALEQLTCTFMTLVSVHVSSAVYGCEWY